MEITKKLMLMMAIAVMTLSFSSCDKEGEDGCEPTYISINIDGGEHLENKGKQGYFVCMPNDGGVLYISTPPKEHPCLIESFEYELISLSMIIKQYNIKDYYEWEWGSIEKTSGEKEPCSYKITLDKSTEYTRAAILNVGVYPFINRIHITQH